MQLRNRILGLLAVVLAVLPFRMHAQVEQEVCTTDYRIDSLRKGELSFELDNISFFKDNEFSGTVMKGYSLPGLWLQPKLVFHPLRNMRLELGAHALIYEGASKYPAMAYVDIATWKGNQYQKGMHILPFFRAQLALNEKVNLVFGNLYGGSNHRLVAPLYNPELNLTADPEMGFQCLYDTKRFHLDAWVNWQSYIFNLDTHQEAFTVGVSTETKLNSPEAWWQAYMPAQLLIQHRGGEQDTITSSSVQTLTNGAVGVGIRRHVNRRALKRFGAEIDVVGHYQQSGELWPYDAGWGVYAQTTFELLGGLHLKGAYLYGDDFISLYGIPYFGTLSTKNEGARYDGMSTVYASVEYARTFKKHFAFGAKADVYYVMPGTMTDKTGARSAVSGGTCFSFGVYLRVNPSFLLKRF